MSLPLLQDEEETKEENDEEEEGEVVISNRVDVKLSAASSHTKNPDTITPDRSPSPFYPSFFPLSGHCANTHGPDMFHVCPANHHPRSCAALQKTTYQKWSSAASGRENRRCFTTSRIEKDGDWASPPPGGAEGAQARADLDEQRMSTTLPWAAAAGAVFSTATRSHTHSGFFSALYRALTFPSTPTHRWTNTHTHTL